MVFNFFNCKKVVKPFCETYYYYFLDQSLKFVTITVVDLIVTRPLIAHLNLRTRLKPTCDRKIGIMGLVYIFKQ